MQELSIISYDLSKCTRTERSSIQRAINGYLDHSFNQKYKYKRKGIIEEIPHIYLNNGVIIVRFSDKSKVIPILRRNKAKVKIFDVFAKKSLLN